MHTSKNPFEEMRVCELGRSRKLGKRRIPHKDRETEAKKKPQKKSSADKILE